MSNVVKTLLSRQTCLILPSREMPSFQDAIFPRRWLLVLHKMTYTIYSKKFKNINYYKILERKETIPTAVVPSVDSRVLWAKMAFLQKIQFSISDQGYQLHAETLSMISTAWCHNILYHIYLSYNSWGSTFYVLELCFKSGSALWETSWIRIQEVKKSEIRPEGTVSENWAVKTL